MDVSYLTQDELRVLIVILSQLSYKLNEAPAVLELVAKLKKYVVPDEPPPADTEPREAPVND